MVSDDASFCRRRFPLVDMDSPDWEFALGIVALHCPPEHVARLAGVSRTVRNACLGLAERQFPELPVVYKESTPAEDALGLVALYCPREDVSALSGVSKAVARACLASKSLPRLFPPVRVDKFSSIEEVRWANDCFMCAPPRPGVLSTGLALTGNLKLLDEAWRLVGDELNLDLVALVGTCMYMKQHQEYGPGRDIILWVDDRVYELGVSDQFFIEFLDECAPGDLDWLLKRFFPNDPYGDMMLDLIEDAWRSSQIRTDEDLYQHFDDLYDR